MQVVPHSESSSRDGYGNASPTLPATGFVRQKLLLQCVPFSKSTLWRRVKAGFFPEPVHLSAGITAWRAEDIHRWIAEHSNTKKCKAE